MSKQRVLRVIPIPSCAMCPHRDHRGAFGFISYVPVCRNMRGRELPHDVVKGETLKGAVAKLKPGIPDWCPLKKGVLIDD